MAMLADRPIKAHDEGRETPMTDAAATSEQAITTPVECIRISK